MGLADITAESVLEAVAEFDRIGRAAFLKRYGFGRAAKYYLVIDGCRYDSKAICGAAHGYARPNQGPLKTLSGGRDSVQRRLEKLGFHVEMIVGDIDKEENPGNLQRNPPWDDRELILALDLYLREGLLDKKHPDVIELSNLLANLPIHSTRPDAERFRNPKDVASKLANFAAIDPGHTRKGMARGSRRNRAIWDRFAGDDDLLAEAAARIQAGREWQDLLAAVNEQPCVLRRPVEAHRTGSFEIQRGTASGQGFRREQPLVHAYNKYLKEIGHETNRHIYSRTGASSPLACDLVDETAEVLYEAKSNTRRESIRMALGQLYDYRRFEPPAMTMAVLLPRKPSQDLIDYLASAHIGVVWQSRDGFGGSGLAGT